MKTLRISLLAAAMLLVFISGCKSCNETGPYQNKPVTIIKYPPVTQAVFSPDSKYIVTVSEDDNARLWKNEASDNPQPIATFYHRGRIDTADFSSDNKRVVTKMGDVYYGWSVEPSHDPKPISIGRKPDWASKYQERIFPIHSPDGKTEITKEGFRILVWKDKTLVESFDGFGPVSFSRNSRLLGIGSKLLSNNLNDVHTIKNFDDLNPKLLWTVAGFSDDGKYVVTHSTDEKNATVMVWQLDENEIPQLVATFRTEEAANSNYAVSVLSPDGKYVAITSGENLNIWQRKD